MKSKSAFAAMLVGALAITTAPAQVSNSVAPAAALATTQAKSPWQFTVAPLMWGAGINGNVTVAGHSANLNVGFDKILEHTDIGFMTYLEARKDTWGLFAQPSYMKLTGSGSVGPLNANCTIYFWIIEAGGFVQIAKWGEEKPLIVNAYAGVRYWNLRNELSFDGPGSLVNVFNGSSTVTITDPVIGLDIQKYLTEKLSMKVRGDIGGFGISSESSDFSWQAIGLLGYDFTKNFSLFAGYRAIAVDKETGSGLNQHGADVMMNGALVGFDFHW